MIPQGAITPLRENAFQRFNDLTIQQFNISTIQLFSDIAIFNLFQL